MSEKQNNNASGPSLLLTHQVLGILQGQKSITGIHKQCPKRHPKWKTSSTAAVICGMSISNPKLVFLGGYRTEFGCFTFGDEFEAK
jgi:hypothetical protein